MHPVFRFLPKIDADRRGGRRARARQCGRPWLDSFGVDGVEDTANLPAVLGLLEEASIRGDELEGHGHGAEHGRARGGEERGEQGASG